MEGEILRALIDAHAHLEALVDRGRVVQDRLESPEYEAFESQVTRAKAAAERARVVIAAAVST